MKNYFVSYFWEAKPEHDNRNGYGFGEVCMPKIKNWNGIKYLQQILESRLGGSEKYHVIILHYNKI